jgi:hypothetical protein
VVVVPGSPGVVVVLVEVPDVSPSAAATARRTAIARARRRPRDRSLLSKVFTPEQLQHPGLPK